MKYIPGTNWWNVVIEMRPGTDTNPHSFSPHRRVACFAVVSAIAVLAAVHDAPAQVFRSYSSSGTLEFNARKNKRREVIKGYYPGGQLEFVATYRKGKLDGDVKQYYENGMLKAEIPYKDGKRDGIAKFYHDNGMLMCKVYYEDNEETGRAKFYDRNGLLTTSVNTDKNRVRRSRRAQRSDAQQDSLPLDSLE